MGFYDCRCMITGVSLHAIGATAVVLGKAGDAYQPLTLGISGSYDRQGSIDMIHEDTNTRLVLTYFRDRVRDGRAVLSDAEYLDDPADFDVDGLLRNIEGNSMALAYPEEQSPPAVTFDGDLLFFSLIAQPVWDALAAAAREGSIDAWFSQTFGQSAVPREIYGPELGAVAEQVRQLAAVNDFVAEHGLGWAPPAEPTQRYPVDYGMQYEVDEFLDEAKRDFAEVPALRSAFDEYERQVAPYREDEY